MSFITRSLSNLTRNILGKTLQATVPSLGTFSVNNIMPDFAEFKRFSSSLQRIHRVGPHIKVRPSRNPLDGNPLMKGVVLRTLVKKPKKPNSANRKCVLVKLSNGKEMVAYVPGIGHNLQEHNMVLCRVGRLRDTPGVKIKCVRGKYDLAHVIKPEPK